MASPQSFRSAFNGFNKEDVVHYLEYLNSRHTSQVEQLQSEISKLKKDSDAGPGFNFSANSELTKKVAELEKMIATREAENAELTRQVSDLQTELAKVRAEKAAAPSQANLELEAYRRAERTERLARERAEQTYQQTSSLLANTAAKVDEASAQISTISDHIACQFDSLREAICSGKRVLSDAVDDLKSLQAESD